MVQKQTRKVTLQYVVSRATFVRTREENKVSLLFVYSKQAELPFRSNALRNKTEQALHTTVFKMTQSYYKLSKAVQKSYGMLNLLP
jgi:hypothetical protein